MGKLTINVTFQASINGVKFQHSETCEIDGVLDVAHIRNQTPTHHVVAQEFATSGGAPAILQDCPSLAVIINSSAAVPARARLRMDDGANSDYALQALLPGQFCIFSEHALGAGIVKMDAATQTTYFNAMTADADAVRGFVGFPSTRVLTAQLATT